MKYCMIILASVLVAGCVSKGPRFNPNARIKAKQTCCAEKNCCHDNKQVNKNKNVSDGDALGKKISGAKKRIKKAVDSGKMTPEEGKEMLDRLNQRGKRNK